MSLQGGKWKRAHDLAGLAFVSNGISTDHTAYLDAGGVGFMVGDGKLNYGRENIIELFYKLAIHEDHFFITPDYQFVINPAYNKDRGPVNIFALRVHTKF
ncbi:MAG: carbohydrate porin [Bacteroidota bacterium]